jgi:hypothetical protein
MDQLTKFEKIVDALEILKYQTVIYFTDNNLVGNLKDRSTGNILFIDSNITKGILPIFPIINKNEVISKFTKTIEKIEVHDTQNVDSIIVPFIGTTDEIINNTYDFLYGSIPTPGLLSVPDIITTVASPQLNLNTQKKILRTSDGTIHVLFSEDLAFKHWISRNNGTSWSSSILESFTTGKYRNCSICKDDNDNLYLATDKSENTSGIWFRKGTVNKSIVTWTWNWGSEIQVTALTKCYYPDISFDNFGFIHIAFARIWTNTRCTWARSINGGTTWTIGTDSSGNAYLFPNYYNYYPTIIKDSLNNLYFFVAPSGGNPDYIKVKKATYSAGPSWNLPSGQGNNISTTLITQSGIVIARCLPDDRLITAWANSTSGNLYFRKTTNSSDISTWNSQIQLDSSVNMYSFGFVIYDSLIITIFYIKNNILYSKTTLDGGITWSVPQIEYNVGINISLNIANTPISQSIDMIWRNNSANPRIVYHAFIGR